MCNIIGCTSIYLPLSFPFRSLVSYLNDLAKCVFLSLLYKHKEEIKEKTQREKERERKKKKEKMQIINLAMLLKNGGQLNNEDF